MINLKDNLNVRKVDDIERFNVNLKVTALEFEKIHKRILDLTRKHEITLEEFLLIYQDFDNVFRSFDAARSRLIRQLIKRVEIEENAKEKSAPIAVG